MGVEVESVEGVVEGFGGEEEFEAGHGAVGEEVRGFGGRVGLEGEGVVAFGEGEVAAGEVAANGMLVEEIEERKGEEKRRDGGYWEGRRTHCLLPSGRELSELT